jgi:hypothetical protein
MKKTILTCFVLLNLATLSQTMTQEIEQDVMEAFKIHAFPGDSLSGFPEKAIREDLATKNVVGQELENHIKQLKRDYINQKFFTVRRKDEKDK